MVAIMVILRNEFSKSKTAGSKFGSDGKCREHGCKKISVAQND